MSNGVLLHQLKGSERPNGRKISFALKMTCHKMIFVLLISRKVTLGRESVLLVKCVSVLLVTIAGNSFRSGIKAIIWAHIK
jgi:hypothetical protein